MNRFEMDSEMNGDLRNQAEQYFNNCRVISRAHYMRGDELDRRHLYLGIPVLVVSTLVGTSIFASLKEKPDDVYKILVGLLSIAAVLLSGLQTLLNFASRSQRHITAGARYAAMKRELEMFRLAYLGNETTVRNDAMLGLKSIVAKLAKLAEENPTVPDRHWAKAYKEVHGIARPDGGGRAPTPSS